MMFKETTIRQNHMKHIYKFCGHKAESFNVKAYGTYGYHCVSKG
jgi:hypothetical protein